VAVTRMKGEAGRCVGALTEGGESLRLKTANGHFPAAGTYSVGQWWDLQYTHDPREAPHVEDVNVTSGTPLASEPDIEGKIHAIGNVWEGDWTDVFDGCLETTQKGSLYIQDDIPPTSTGFWLPDQELTLIDGHYHYDGGHARFAFAGTMAKEDEIEAGTLIRLSLAGWWRPPNADPDFPLRCYAQVSGWY